MAYLVLVVGFSAMLVGVLMGTAPIVYAAFTGRFYEGAGAPSRSIREHPKRFVRLALFCVAMTAICIAGVIKLGSMLLAAHDVT